MSAVAGRPFLRWAGGKRWLAPLLAEHLSGWDGLYVEPFLGSGAVFFALQPKRAVLADTNEDLIACYRGVQNSAEEVVERLLSLQTNEECYYRVRAERPAGDIDRAARFIYLNRISFNGLWRVNRAGEYNVPYGHKAADLSWLKPDIVAAGLALRHTDIVCRDFKQTMSNRRAGALIFCDPPYITGHADNGFREYNQKLFSWADQEELARRALDAAARGVDVIVSNAHHEGLASLYAGLEASTHRRHGSLSGQLSGRGHVEEYLFASKAIHTRLQLPASSAH